MNDVPAIAVGCVAAAGVLLVASPLLWPATGARPQPRDGMAERMRTRLALAGLRGVPPAAFALVSALVGLAVGALAQALVGVPVLSIAAGTIGFGLPTAIVVWRARARRLANRAVWPDVIDHVVSAVRAGLALPDAIGALAESGPTGTREDFAEFRRDYRATGNFGHCLDRLKARLADPVADRLLETLRMAREVGGGDLGDVLRALAAYLREDAVVRAELRARQSWIVNAARLGVVAPWIVLLLLATRPEGAAAYNSPAGGLVIVVGLLVSFIAYRLMIRAGRLPEDERWFR
ncbi:MAG: type II secretion system F family protein [Leifsonia sp.]